MPAELLPVPTDEKYQLQKLSPKHKEALSLLAQGTPRPVIEQITGVGAEYLTWLLRQPVCKEYLQGLTEYADARLAALYDKSVDVIAEGMAVGNTDEKLKAAKLQLEAIGKVGRQRDPVGTAPSPDRLRQLAERLVSLLQTTRNRTLEGEATVVESQ